MTSYLCLIDLFHLIDQRGELVAEAESARPDRERL